MEVRPLAGSGVAWNIAAAVIPTLVPKPQGQQRPLIKTFRLNEVEAQMLSEAVAMRHSNAGALIRQGLAAIGVLDPVEEARPSRR